MNFDRERDYSCEAEIIKAVSHPVRLKILTVLSSEQCDVRHIWESCGLPQSTVSRHLAQLKDCGVITGKRVGKKIHYEVIHPSVRKIVDVLGKIIRADDDINRHEF